MQISYFNNGGFAIHGIKGNFKGKCSGLFDKDGVLYSSEQLVDFMAGRYSCCRSRTVKVDGPIWRHLQKIGKRFVGLNK